MESPLAKPRDVYRPFTSAETRTLRDFVANVRELAEMRFFKQVPREFTITFGIGDPTQSSMAEPDREDVRAAVTLFRQIYTPSEPTSAAVVLNLLKRSAHEDGAPLREAAIGELKDLGQWTSELPAAGSGMGTFKSRDQARLEGLRERRIRSHSEPEWSRPLGIEPSKRRAAPLLPVLKDRWCVSASLRLPPDRLG